MSFVPSKPRMFNPYRSARARPRLVIGVLLAVLVGVLTPGDWRVATRALVAWNTGIIVYLIIIGWMIARSNEKTIRARAALEDEQQWVILLLGIMVACASVVAIFAQLGAVKDMTGWEKGLHVGLAGLTILTSWLFIHMLFALHYAHEYYAPTPDPEDDPDATRAGLNFPGERPPAYGDFLYYSYVIGVASQTADVETVSRAMRRTSLTQGVVSFFFNTVVLALTINIAAGLI
jgi:uncharacterized membrane protein